jgi:hypothetical protein
MLQKTLLGWIVSGEFTSQHSEIVNENSDESNDSNSDRKLETLIEKVYQLETFSSEGNNFFLEEAYCESYFEKTTLRNSEGRFIVKLPFGTIVLLRVTLLPGKDFYRLENVKRT